MTRPSAPTSGSAPAPADSPAPLLSADENRSMFDAVARRYDLLNRLLSLGRDRYWRRRAVDELGPRPEPGGRYLDVGTGTGDVAVELLRRAPGASVVGVDLSLAMMALASSKLDRAEVSGRAAFAAGDAGGLPFRDGEFSGVISAFGLRNMVGPADAVAEMARVLRPGGRLVVLELTRPKGRLLRALHRCYCRVWVPVLGRVLSRGEAYRFLVRSIQEFPPPEQVMGMMEAAGLAGVSHVPLSGGIVTLFSGEAGS